jgi:hypothetical protein
MFGANFRRWQFGAIRSRTLGLTMASKTGFDSANANLASGG